MLDEFVFVAKAVFVQHAVFVNHDGVLDTAAQRKVVLAQVLDVTHEAEGTGAADFLHERGAGEVDAGTLGPVA
ncbi:hypothetical protein D3C76_1679450 [compost metagenome]